MKENDDRFYSNITIVEDKDKTENVAQGKCLTVQTKGLVEASDKEQSKGEYIGDSASFASFQEPVSDQEEDEEAESEQSEPNEEAKQQELE